MQTLELQLATGVTLAVPASLQSITTYVLLEQETWFEKEMDFLRCWLQPGMTVVDIGAHLGVYSLPMAKLVGPSGKVFAYEPSSQTREILELNRRLNKADNLQIFPFAMSDSAREGRIAFGISSELNALGGSGEGENVRITSLDIEDKDRSWSSPDFVKIDTEGEEERVFAGGKDFFTRHSPLVMVEVQLIEVMNERLRRHLPTLGYRLYRQLGGAPILVAEGPDSTLDPFEINLFAAKPDRAASVAASGLLVEKIPVWTPGKADIRYAEEFWRTQKFSFLTGLFKFQDITSDAQYGAALAGYAAWRDASRPIDERCGALAFAFDTLQALCARAPNTARLSTLARVAWEWGAREKSIAALAQLQSSFESGVVLITEPFWPACRRFDDISPAQQPADWFMAAVVEQMEKTAFQSSIFGNPSAGLNWYCGLSYASAEMKRKLVLHPAYYGQLPKVHDHLLNPAADHLNAAVWRAGKVPGTIL